MSTPLPPRSKTIDNLGIDPSVRYAQDQEYLDKKITKDPFSISSQAQIDVMLPCFSSEFDQMFQVSLRNKEWAAFMNPPKFTEQKKRLFTFQILPSLGTEETIQVHAQRLKDRLEKEEEKRKRKKKERESSKQKEANSFEEDIQFEEAEQESVKLLRLIEIICNLDKILIEINARRNQYQKG